MTSGATVPGAVRRPQFEPGDRVSHARFGGGTVTKVDQFHTTIDFDGRGERRFLSEVMTLAPLISETP
jgi:hypothetical protein